MADASVRTARAQDVPEIARIQLDTWRIAYSRLLPESLLDGLTTEQAEATWAAAVTAPPSPRHHVLVATEGDTTVGFVAFGPADPADAEHLRAEPVQDPDHPHPAGTILTLLVEPRWGRRGHGSRLLAAAVDHLRADGIDHALAWVLDRDVATTSFYESAGWERDGYARGLDADGRELREIRLHTLLTEEA